MKITEKEIGMIRENSERELPKSIRERVWAGFGDAVYNHLLQKANDETALEWYRAFDWTKKSIEEQIEELRKKGLIGLATGKAVEGQTYDEGFYEGVKMATEGKTEGQRTTKTRIDGSTGKLIDIVTNEVPKKDLEGLIKAVKNSHDPNTVFFNGSNLDEICSFLHVDKKEKIIVTDYPNDGNLYILWHGKKYKKGDWIPISIEGEYIVSNGDDVFPSFYYRDEMNFYKVIVRDWMPFPSLPEGEK